MVDFKIPTPEALLQLGYDCGLNTVAEAYACMMNHYDAFFLIEDINRQVSDFHKSLVTSGLAWAKINLLELSIADAAKKLNYTLKDQEHPDLEEQLEKEEFEFDPFDFGVSGPDLMDKEDDSSGD